MAVEQNRLSTALTIGERLAQGPHAGYGGRIRGAFAETRFDRSQIFRNKTQCGSTATHRRADTAQIACGDSIKDTYPSLSLTADGSETV